MQKNQKSYEKDIAGVRLSAILRNVSNRTQQLHTNGVDANDIANDPDLKILTLEQQQIETEVQALQNFVDIYTQQINSLNNDIKDGIKSSCGLSLSGGGS